MSGELWEETVGKAVSKPDRRWPAAYDTCINQTCPRCEAKPGKVCVSTDRSRRFQHQKSHPCLVRLALGEGWAHPVETGR